MDTHAWRFESQTPVAKEELFCACGRRLVTADELALVMCEWCQDAEMQAMYEQGNVPEREEE